MKATVGDTEISNALDLAIKADNQIVELHKEISRLQVLREEVARFKAEVDRLEKLNKADVGSL